MTFVHHCIVLFALVLTFVSCKKDEASTTPTDQYADKLTLGTGMSGFVISGETVTFTKNPSNSLASIYWRLECKDDYGNQGARLQIDKSVSGAWQAYATVNPPVLQDYGHIYVNGPVKIAVGTYRATGIHIGSSRTVAVVNFVVN